MREASALTWQHPQTREWFYLPTDPERKRWRGPFNGIDAMRRAMVNELGCEPVETQTRRTPSDFRESDD